MISLLTVSMKPSCRKVSCQSPLFLDFVVLDVGPLNQMTFSVDVFLREVGVAFRVLVRKSG